MHPLPRPTNQARPSKQFVTIAAELYFGSVVLERGDIIDEHVHPAPHATIIASGAARLWIDGEHSADLKAGQVVEMGADRHHAFQALENGTLIMCVWRAEVAEAMFKGVSHAV